VIEDIPRATLTKQKMVLSLNALTALIDWNNILKSLSIVSYADIIPSFI
jgi:hypothetical protein